MTNEDEFYKEVFGWTDIEYLPNAMNIAVKAHDGQLRDEGTPYIEHIKGVIKILTTEFDIQSDTALSIAALHDVLEDSNLYTYEDLQEHFGEAIADGVQLLTKKDNQDIGEYMAAIKNAPRMSWLILIKLADRIHNLRCLKLTNNAEKIRRKCKETRLHYLGYASKYPAIHKLLLDELTKLEEAYA